MVIIWMAQFLSLMGFSFAFPFVAYFLQEDLNVTGHGELKMWVALFSAASAVMMAIAAPIWGMLADRYGKRVMLIRANLAGAVVMSLMGNVQTPGMLIVLRLLQGALTGTMTAAQAFMSGEMPPERRGFAIGGLAAAMYSGTMSGAFLGGFVAHWMGYRAAFYVSGALLLAAFLLILCCTKETTLSAVRRKQLNPAQPRVRWNSLPKTMYTVLIMIGAVSLVRQFDISFLPLLVQDIHGSMDGVALWSGALNASGSIAGMIAGLATGWFSDRFSPLRLMVVSAVLAGLFSGWQMVIHSFTLLFVVRFFTVFFAGSLEPALNAWLAKRIPETKQGMAFGWASTLRSIGWAVGPLLAGVVATVNLRAVFGFAGVGFLLLAVVLGRSLKQQFEPKARTQ
jgi:DHA1 family multidrug resistance protein-like MFS transporter